MNSETASRRSLFGLAGAASLCCLAPAGAAVAGGGAAVGLGTGLGQLLVTVLTLALVGVVVRWRTDCSETNA
ncbi:hypothetical protein RBH26_20700 [Natronolimnohabitans sp. A-GB9]|uniref:hypothetical protein n=1 Tax=Natronolimnohabitans sp. A-GB9 TaxID=3069757 RepID=UPI0027B6881F|nr:hypothetical protein [Natronolimnohabitans sp. A-GB9]MDQ2052865.1 hypothetical protein [Natronolimnohabitans sp. A-GB9]